MKLTFFSKLGNIEKNLGKTWEIFSSPNFGKVNAFLKTNVRV